MKVDLHPVHLEKYVELDTQQNVECVSNLLASKIEEHLDDGEL
jgi:hypothetical protein